MGTLIVNSAHAESLYTCLAFSRDGSKIYTGGEEGYVRIWKTDLGSEQEPEVAVEGEDAITSIAASQNRWLSGSRDTCVRTYDAQGSMMEGLVTRVVAVPVRCVAIDPKGDRVAVASDELEVKIIDLNDITCIQKLEGHRRGIRKVTWHPSGSLLTTCGSDGDIIVWKVTPEDGTNLLETVSGFLPSVDPESPDYVHDCSALWHPSGKYFVVASRAHELVAVSRTNWKKTFTFSDDAATGPVTALAFSPNGTYLASATPTGIYIWSTATRKILFKHVPNKSLALVSHLAFSPTQNLLAWTDADGSLTRWPDPIPAASPDPVGMERSSSHGVVIPQKRKDPLSFDEDGDDNAKKDDPTDGLVREENTDAIDDEDWMIDDIGLLDKTEKELDQVDGAYAREMVSVTKAQPAFQPGSTPMINKKRYLAYNMIGVIEATDQDTHHIINVEFHDRTTRAGFHFQDSQKCDLASLGERGAVYACQPENGRPAQIIYKPFSGWGSASEWHYALSEGESVTALAAGGRPPSSSLRNKSSDGDVEGHGNVVVSTSKGYLRFLTGGGVQSYLWSLGADVVSMVAGCEWVFVVHRDGGTSLDGCQNLVYTLVALETFDIVQQGRLPLPRGTVLKWIGISEEGAPAMYDSNGLLSVLDRFRRPGQARWLPLLDTTTLARRQGKDESYWPVGTSGSLFMCLILKGREVHPGFPRPLIQELEVQIPLFNLDVLHGQLEERFLREEIHVGMLRDALGSTLTSQEISQRENNLDKQLIQLVQLACKGDQLQRALDAAALLHHVQSFDMAVKVAEFYHLLALPEKLMAMKNARVELDRLEEERRQRFKWKKYPTPISAPQNRVHDSSRRSYFEEFAFPLETVRNSLAPATLTTTTPGLEQDGSMQAFKDSAMTAAAIRAGSSESGPCDDTFTSDQSHPSLGDGKRKRDDHDMPEMNLSIEYSLTKKRALTPTVTTRPSIMNPTKASVNPFARKPQDTKNSSKSHSGTSNAILTKSNSFFDKVAEGNDIATKPKVASNKSKENKNTHRQTTLFGLFPSAGVDKRDPQQKRNPTGDIDEAELTQVISTQTLEASISQDVLETQATEVTTADVSQS